MNPGTSRRWATGSLHAAGDLFRKGNHMPFEKPTVEQLAHRFDYHCPNGDQAERYERIRSTIKSTAIICVNSTPCSPEQTRALNALDEAMFLFNASIARHE